jgi:hypothetical protein
MYPAYAVGIRSHRTHTSDAFALPRCHKNALHGVVMGEWETKAIADGEPIPPGWREQSRYNGMVFVRRTYWERISL